jgi:antitoxin PrlF
MKVTTKGQVTIPQELREQLRIRPGTEVEFKIDGKTLTLLPLAPGRKSTRSVAQRLRGRATVRMSTDEILALTRGE